MASAIPAQPAPFHLDLNVMEVMLALSPSALAALSAASQSLSSDVRAALPTLATNFQRAELPLANPSSLWHLLCYSTLASHCDAFPAVQPHNVAAGRGHVVIADDGSPFLVGGIESEDEPALPLTSVSRLDMPWPVAAVACGAQHALLLDVFGGLQSFGCGADGQLGHGGLNTEKAPRRVAAFAGSCVVDISAGNAHSLALAVNASETAARTLMGTELYAWGLNEEGQLGIGTRTSAAFPTTVGGTAHRGCGRLSCGDFHSALVTARGDLYTWGYGRAGRLGHGTEEDELRPKRVKAPSERSSLVDATSLRHFSGVACGSSYTIACMGTGASRTLWSTGQGWDGQLGLGRRGQGAFEMSLTLLQLPLGSAPLKSLALRDGAAALLADGGVVVWGNAGAIAGDRIARPTVAAALQRSRAIAWGGGDGAESFAVIAEADADSNLLGNARGRHAWRLRRLVDGRQLATTLALA